MFETGKHSAALIRALDAAPPVATSLAAEVYRYLPNDTDFTPLIDAGMTGLNFAVIGGSARYHSPEDDLAHVDAGSLQDLGETVLSAARELSAMDLRQVSEASEASWFNLGPLLVRYPSGAVLPLALAAPVALSAAVWFARRRSSVGLRGTVRAALTLPIPLVAVAALGWLAWRAQLLVRPSYALFAQGDPYRTGLAVTGLLLLTAAVVWLWTAWVGRRASTLETVVGTVGWPALLGVVTAVLLPGGAYVFTWTALGGAAGVALAAPTAEGSARRTAVIAASALPGVVVTAPLIALLFPTLGLASAAVPMTLAVVAVAIALVPLAGRIDAARFHHAIAGGIATALVGTALVGANAAVGAPDEEHPLPVSLMYALDADRERAYWVSQGWTSQPWISHYTGTQRSGSLEQRFPELVAPPDGFLVGDAPVAPISRPVVRVLSEARNGGTRSLRLSVRSEAGTPVWLALHVDTSSTRVMGARVSCAPENVDSLDGGANRDTGSVWKWGLLLAAPPRQGCELTLTVRDSGRDVRLLAVAKDVGLPESAMDRPRPDDLTWSPHAAGVSFASRGYTL